MTPHPSKATDTRRRTGFTLVELLVALGLVSLIMLMFAQVFEIATGMMSTQRGIMENDQRARSLTTVIKNDLEARTMRSVIPFQPNELDYTDATYYSFAKRQGFLSISENDVNNDADDVLHFTIQLSVPADAYYGRGAEINPQPPMQGNPDYLNQPDFDDYGAAPNTAASYTAEVVYFLRNGNLYRRVLLLREPSDPSQMNRQPSYTDSGTGAFVDLFDPANLYYPIGRDFWRDYDFSATWGGAAGARFIGGGAAGNNPLNNATGGSLTYGAIAKPTNRFGHNPILTHGNGSGPTASVGNPREFLGTQFIGRFTQEETSHPNFNYPHSPSADESSGTPGVTFGTLGVPVDPIDTPVGVLTDTTPANGVIDQFERGSRRGEDLLLSNVHAFDVKVWDEIYHDYVDIGHNLSNTLGVAGDFHIGRNRRPTYGPNPAGNNRMFDTWHPQFNANNDTDTLTGLPVIDTNDTPPYLMKYDYSISGNYWQPGTVYNVNDIVIPNTTALETFYYQMVGTSPAGVVSPQSGLTEPAWPTSDGVQFTDNQIIWRTVYNLKRIRSVKITIRYLDVSSDQMRQVTLIESLMN